jgi:hypothetical protein
MSRWELAFSEAMRCSSFSRTASDCPAATVSPSSAESSWMTPCVRAVTVASRSGRRVALLE